MSKVFDKRIFKNKENKNTLINLKIYERNLSFFNINSLLGKVYPSLLSKCITFKNGNYWEKTFNIFSLLNFIINPLKIIRLIFGLSVVLSTCRLIIFILRAEYSLLGLNDSAGFGLSI